jgi:hypothetical protein
MILFKDATKFSLSRFPKTTLALLPFVDQEYLGSMDDGWTRPGSAAKIDSAAQISRLKASGNTLGMDRNPFQTGDGNFQKLTVKDGGRESSLLGLENVIRKDVQKGCCVDIQAFL